ncbi:MAG: glycoside hydrolase family 127 protein, partial [Verrucomicrobia bacterium]|nr:glycoside hydrolase family 127 protein [Verrucomicrobiota bacterium]
GTVRVFKPEFTVLHTEENPQKKLRRGAVGTNHGKTPDYKVATWGQAVVNKIDPNAHVMDGFNPENDKGIEPGRTADYFQAATNEPVTAQSAKFSGDTIKWSFPEVAGSQLSAEIKLPAGKGLPELTFTFVPGKEGYYSIGYTGAPGVSPSEMDEMWQPMIWQEKRLPNLSYLTEAFLCPLPTTLVTYQGTTVGVLADPSAIPFMPLPNKDNSRFGVMVRDRNGLARPMLFAPVLGGPGSKMSAGEAFTFKAHLLLYKGSLLGAFEDAAKNYYGFKDYRQNSTVTLNKTLENMIDYNMSAYSQFVEELRGCSYATDVPGAVKNITGLSPLSLAFVTDNEAIFKKRARPMLEYSWSRERFLFSTNPEVKGDGTSSKLEGPSAPMSDFIAAYLFSGKRITADLKLSEKIYHTPINLCLNLSELLDGDQWQNAMYLYKATGDKKYLDLAITGADRYLKERIDTPQTDFSDKVSRDMFFWTSYVPHWMEIYLLYEMTGKKRFLDAAHRGARQFAQFIWFCPAVPEEKILVNIGNKAPRYRAGDKFKDMMVPEETVDAWRVSEIGLTPESAPTCNGHRGIYMTQFAPWMMRIARDTKDSFLHDVARSAVIGRYESFPGYHINAGRTTAHEKADFPLRSLPELNGVTSLHFNHPWPHAAMLLDYLVSDVYYRSDARIDFPAEYAEGYAYCHSRIYGAHSGHFYDEKNVWLYMPRGLLSSSNVQINYLAARGNGKLYLALTNQSKEPVTTTLTLNSELLGLQKGKEYSATLWKDNLPAGSTKVVNGQISVPVLAEGLTALSIDGVDVRPTFQANISEKSAPWKKDSADLAFGGGSKAVLFNFGPNLQSVYSFTKATGELFSKVTLHYECNGKWSSVTKESYPFDFTVEVPRDADDFRFWYEAVTKEGGIVKSEEGVLLKK